MTTPDDLRSLLAANQDRVYSLCFQVLRHAQDAEDAAQASLIEIARGVGRLEDPAAFPSWLYRVCLHNALNLRRERRRRKAREERSASMRTSAGTAGSEEVRDAIHEALTTLDDEERALVIEHYFEKVTIVDLAARRGVTGAAIWKRISRARERLRTALEAAGMAIGLAAMTSELEAAEAIPAPPGLSLESALRPPVASPSRTVPAVTFAAAIGILIATATIIGSRPDPETPVATAAAASVNSASPAAPPRQETANPPAPPPVNEGEGRVLGPDGNPLQGVLIFPGRWHRLRGDDAFDPFRPHLIRDGVVTDSEGRFTLATDRPFVSAWHAEFSALTVRKEDISSMRLPARGAIRGRIVDASGKPMSGVAVSLDKRGPTATSGDDGAFDFDKVAAGYRGLMLPNRRRIAVRVDPGETVTLEIGPGVDVALDLAAHPSGPGTKISGGLIGMDRLFTLGFARGETPSLTVAGVVPGRYFYLDMQGGRGWVTVSDGEARVEFGRSILEIHAAVKTSFHVLPAGANEVMEIALMKFGAFKAGPGEPVRIDNLPEGDYEIRDPEGVTIERVTAGPGETRITLRAK